MTQPLLTIAIPTFNRASHLELLLKTLSIELEGLCNKIEIIVFDNASTDRTPEVCRNFVTQTPSAFIVRNETNIGAENNFLECFSRAQGHYFWMIGDDDLPKSGLINKLLSLVAIEDPDLIYMESEWLEKICTPKQNYSIEKLHAKQISLNDLAIKINIWFTFISAIVINRNFFFKSHSLLDARRYHGTNLVQLGWVLEVLKSGNKFFYIEDKCIVATANNSGGYEIVKTFCINFPRIVNEVFSENNNLARRIIRRCLISHTPEIIWEFRFNNNLRFEAEEPWDLLLKAHKFYPEYWLILVPIAHFPKIFSHLFLQVSYLINYIINWNYFISKKFKRQSLEIKLQ